MSIYSSDTVSIGVTDGINPITEVGNGYTGLIITSTEGVTDPTIQFTFLNQEKISLLTVGRGGGPSNDYNGGGGTSSFKVYGDTKANSFLGTGGTFTHISTSSCNGNLYGCGAGSYYYNGGSNNYSYYGTGRDGVIMLWWKD